MHRRCRLLLVASVLAISPSIAAAQTVIDSPPTVIPFQGTYLLEGGTTLNAYPGAQIHSTLGIQDGTLNLLGADLTQGVNANNGATVNIFDGMINGGPGSDFLMSSGSVTTIRGGRLSDSIVKQTAATLIIEGVDFQLNGVPVSGLLAPGDEASVEIPTGTLFTGIFSDGAPFTIESQLGSGARIFGQVTLRQSTRPAGPSIVNVPAMPMPPGVLPGQTLNAHAGAILPAAMNAAPGGIVNLEGGQTGLFELNAAQMNVNSGAAGALHGYRGSTIRLNGGTTGQVAVYGGSQVEVNGGTLGTLAVFPDTDIQINGGTVSRLDFFHGGSEATMRGGNIEQRVKLELGSTFRLLGGSITPFVGIPSGAHMIMSGGTVGVGEYPSIVPANGSELTILGRQFSIAGEPVTGLNNPGDSIIVADRPDLTLDLILADGSPMKLYLGTVRPPRDQPQPNIIPPGATLRLTLVIPEPSASLLFIVAAFALLRRAPLASCQC
jgi:hypothetical protein